MKIHGETTEPSPLGCPMLDLGRSARRGIWIGLGDPAAVELISAEGPDWIAIDGQHGHAESGDLLALIDAANVFGVPALVRAPGHDLGTATRIVDSGAQGVIFPTVENGEQARRLLEACRFPPRGKRSFGPTRRSPRYAKPTPGEPASDPLVILMVETEAALGNLDEILAAGPDGVFVGPYDLSLSLGVSFDQLLAEDPDGVLRSIARRCAEAGVVPGMYTGSPELSARPLEWGYRFMPVGLDCSMLAMAARGLCRPDPSDV